jgi:hypothetical protein
MLDLLLIVADEEFGAWSAADFVAGVHGAVFGRDCLGLEALENPSDLFVVF